MGAQTASRRALGARPAAEQRLCPRGADAQGPSFVLGAPSVFAFDAGFVLAAVMSGDGDVAALECLAPGSKARVGQRVLSLQAQMETDRGQALRQLAFEAKHRVIDGRAEARRVLAVLSTEVERERGAVWLAAVPRQRPGFAVAAPLRDRLARQCGRTDAERAARECTELDAALEASSWPA
jgi:hypothetical protein